MRETLEDMLIRHEGMRHKAYKDSVGKLTIGVGRNLDDIGITDAEARMMLGYDIARANEEALKFPWFSLLDDVRKDVILSMIFNMGPFKFRQFTKMIICMSNKNYNGAAEEMINSKWSVEVGDRAKELSAMMLSGQYIPHF